MVFFAAAENLSYFAAFPERGAFYRLFWSEPVHLVSALCEALAAAAAFAWLWAFNPAASGAVPGRSPAAMAPAGATRNLAALVTPAGYFG